MKTYPLSQSQMGVFLELTQHPQTTQYNISYYASLPKSIDTDRLEQALKTIYATRPEWRIRFLMEGDEPRQTVDDTRQLKVSRLSMSESQCEAYIWNFVKPYDIFRDVLCCFHLIETPKRIVLAMDFSHLISDSMSLTSLFLKRDLPLAYIGKPLPEQACELLPWAENEDRQLSGSVSGMPTSNANVYETDKEYYREHFQHCEMLSLAEPVKDPLGRSVRYDEFLSEQEVKVWCTQHDISPGLLLMAAFAYTLSVAGRTSQFAFTTASHGRTQQRIRQAFGMFVRIVPVKTIVTPDTKVTDFILAFRHELADVIHNHANYPFTHFCRDLQMKPGVCFNFLGKDITEEMLLEDTLYPVYRQYPDTTCSDLTLDIWERDGVYNLRLMASDMLYGHSFLQTFARMFKTVVQEMMHHPEGTLASLRLTDTEEQEVLIRLGMGEVTEYDTSETLVSLFRKQAQLHPEATAVVDKDSSITYAELNRKSDILAHLLRQAGVGQDCFVAVMLPRRKEFMLAILAIFKAGGAYLPLDSEYPEERLRYMLEDSGARIIITVESLAGAMPQENDSRLKTSQAIFIDQIDFNKDSQPVDYSQPQSLAYMIYTSGSTGKPKGVMVEHRNLRAFTAWIVEMLGLSGTDRCAVHASFSFDASVLDLMPPLAVGAQVHILSETLRKDMYSMNRYFSEEGISGMILSTQIGMEMVNTFGDLPLKYLVVGGEALKPMRKTSVPIINVYGPTEVTVCITTYVVDQDRRHGIIPIGRPVPGIRLFVIDREGRLLPRGMTGELCVAGSQVTRGYWNRAEQTNERYTECPFIEEDDQGRKARMYRTGDLCRWNEQGELEYVGRIDTQVKLRGFRIELGEIEACASKYEGIRQTAAEVIDGEQLCLYYTETGNVNERALREFLAKTLPDYMVPTVFVRLSELPLTPNGKVDRRSLPKPEPTEEEYVAPATDIEKNIATILCELLRLDRLGVTTDLRAAGMNSINAMRAKIHLSEQFRQDLDVTALLRLNNIRELSEYMEGHAASHRPQLTSHPTQETYPVPKTLETYMADYMVGKPTFAIPFAIRIRGARLDEMEKALRAVFNSNPSMKARTCYRDGQPVMLRDDTAEIPIAKYTMDSEPSDAQVLAYCDQTVEIVGGFLGTYALIESPAYGYLAFKCSHGNMDGGAIDIFLREFRAALAGGSPKHEEYTVFDYAIDEQHYLASDQLKWDENHFLRVTGGLLESVLPFDDESEDGRGFAETISTVFDKSLTDDYCSRNEIRQSCFFATLFMQALGHAGGWQKVMISSLHSNRQTSELAGMMSMAMRNFPLVCKHITTFGAEDMEEVFLSEVRSIEQQMNDAMDINFYDYYGANGLGRKSPNIAMKAVFVYQVGVTDKFAEDTTQGTSCTSDVRIISPESMEPPIRELAMEPLKAYVELDNVGNYKLGLKYNHRCYHTATIQQMADYIHLFFKQLT